MNFILFILLPVLIASVSFISYNQWNRIRNYTSNFVFSKNDLLKEESLLEKNLKPKYESDLIETETRIVLKKTPNDIVCGAFDNTYDEEFVSVEVAMKQTKNESSPLTKREKIFVMLNGKNEGLFVHYPYDNKSFSELYCLYEILFPTVITLLGGHTNIYENGIRLYNQMGIPIQNLNDLNEKANRIIHVLYDFQLWTWPGIHIGYIYNINNILLQTMSLKPLVFSVQNFFTKEEANSILKEGMNHLSRSPVVSPKAIDGYDDDRTSDTAFLNDSNLTRMFCYRTKLITRLPSSSFAENLQLVRYKPFQFFRKHEDYFSSKTFVPFQRNTWKKYKIWCSKLSKKLDEVMIHLNSNQIENNNNENTSNNNTNLLNLFLPGNELYPNADDNINFQHSLLRNFLSSYNNTDFFYNHGDLEWEKWINENLEINAHGILQVLLKDRPYMLSHIILAWEKKIKNVSSEIALFSQKIRQHEIENDKEINGVTHWFRWIQWAKEAINFYIKNNNRLYLDPSVYPNGKNYPTYYKSFQKRILNYVIDDDLKKENDRNLSKNLRNIIGNETYEWMINNIDKNDLLLDLLRNYTQIVQLATDSWEKRAAPMDLSNPFHYRFPNYLRHFEPNRYVTVFLYLNTVEEGGETVFPYSKERFLKNITREGMSECSEGLAIPAKELTASLFYSQTTENTLDPLSLHGGCPPHKGIKYGANSFTWNVDADEGSNAWDFGEDLKADD